MNRHAKSHSQSPAMFFCLFCLFINNKIWNVLSIYLSVNEINHLTWLKQKIKKNHYLVHVAIAIDLEKLDKLTGCEWYWKIQHPYANQ